jgi:hypothetical protein
VPISRKQTPDWWSWQTILENAHCLGIPNFQRGAVWDLGNRVALLESLYEQSPCGSFVFWQPDDDSSNPERHGVPLVVFRDPAPLWLVDGQQRTRALLDTFLQILEPHTKSQPLRLVREADLNALRLMGRYLIETDHRETDDSDQGDDCFEAVNEMFLWMVVLPAMPIFDGKRKPFFGKYSESRFVQRGSMFRRFHPRARSRWNEKGQLKPVPPIPPGTIPLAALITTGGVFVSTELRIQARTALQTFQSESPDLNSLDDLLPWGPQFVTGHAFESPASPTVQARPMTWSDIVKRRSENSIIEQVQRIEDLFKDSKRSVFKRFPEMITGKRIAVDWLPRCSVSTAINAYVRINRAGIRVRAEEQALALLTRARSTLLDDFAHYIGRRDKVIVEDQRALLAHESVCQMGFSVWMATVTRYSALFLLGDTARKWLWTKAIEKTTFSNRIDRVGPDETETGRSTWADTFASPNELILEASSRVTEALLLIDDILSTELFWDHRMARTQFASLQPLIDLFSRIPIPEVQQLGKDQSFREALAKIMLWTLHFPYIDKPSMETLVIAIHGINEETAKKEASPLPTWSTTGKGGLEELQANIRAALRRYTYQLKELWSSKPDFSKADSSLPGMNLNQEIDILNNFAIKSFDKETREAKSLQHRCVGWLYSIERRNGATEFSWAAQFSGNTKDAAQGIPQTSDVLPGELPLGRLSAGSIANKTYPEKQHIVPFVYAAKIVNKGGTRATVSLANAIGNLTWLSRRQNSLEGLADRWTVMDVDVDRKNLQARGFLAVSNFGERSPTVLEIYQELQSEIAKNESGNMEYAYKLYHSLCQSRREWMVDQMHSWLFSDLSINAKRWLEA